MRVLACLLVVILTTPVVAAPPDPPRALALEAPSTGTSDEQEPVSTPAPGSPFEVKLALDLPLTLALGAAGAVTEWSGGSSGPATCQAIGDPTGLNALDRTVVGNRSAAAALASDVLVTTAILAPYVLDALDVWLSEPSDGWLGYGKDAVVLTEALALDFALNQVVKYAVRRPRPYTYDGMTDQVALQQTDANLSFYSSHSSISFVMATASSTLFTARHPDSPWVVPVWLASHALAATTAVLRVEAGKHFWTDVLTGAVIGSAIGLIVPYLHRTKAGEEARADGLQTSLVPVILPDGLGIAVRVW